MNSVVERKYFKIIAHAYLQVFLLFAIPVFAKNLPVSIMGKWEVSEVHTNTEAPRTSFYVWNDPRLKGRIFTFGSGEIWNDTPEGSECMLPSSKLTSDDPQVLIEKSMAGYGYPARQADAQAYRLDISQGKVATVTQIYCGTALWNGSLGADGGVQGSWLFLDDNRMLLRWYDETILILDRIYDDEKPKPSFDCAKSSNQTENEICHSIELSSFDNSIYDAYKLAISQYGNAGDNYKLISRDQRTWLAKRNKCGTDRKCILASMRKRLDELFAPTQ